MTKEEIEMYVEELIKETLDYRNSVHKVKFNENDIVKSLLSEELINTIHEYFNFDPEDGAGKKDSNGKLLFFKSATKHFKNGNSSRIYFTEPEQIIFLNTLFIKMEIDLKFV